MWEMLKAAWTGMFLRCPACGKGHIYRTFTEMHPACPRCGVVFEREEGDFLGAMVVAYSMTAVLVVTGIFLVEWLTDLNPYGHMMLWSAFTALFLLVFYRNMKGIWTGILHVMVGLRQRP